MKCKVCNSDLEKIDDEYKCTKCGNTQKGPGKQYMYPLSEIGGKFKKRV